MWKALLQSAKATFPLIMMLFSTLCIITPGFSQQNIIAHKDETRPAMVNQFAPPSARVQAFSAQRFNGYNELTLRMVREQATRRLIVEYSYDGVNFQTAGQLIPGNGAYELKHYISNDRPLLYRIRMEDLDGQFHYSDNIFLNGRDILPVTIYPTVVTGNIVNVNANFPVQRVSIISPAGQQVFAKDINGADEFMKINIPSLGKGWYIITFYGNGWQSSSKFMVG